MARVTNSVQRKVTDENGEIKYSEEEKTVNYGKEPNYVKVYLDNILYLNDLPRGLSTTLYALLKRMSYGNQLVINAALKRQIGEEVGLSQSSINNAITKFVKGQLLIRKDTGLYIVNPHLFGKGEWKDISEIRLDVTFSAEGKTMMAEVKKEEDKEKENQASENVEPYEQNEPKNETPENNTEDETHEEFESMTPEERDIEAFING